MLIHGDTGDWEVVIGLEIHAQITTDSKLFSGAATVFGAEPNTQVSLVDAAMPGMLPVINDKCIEQAVRTGLGINAKINLYSVFDRKNYFYPDLPQGYQISQFTHPIVGEGVIDIEVDGETYKIGITRLHLEQDAGKSVHDLHPSLTYVDLNRSGIALMEIVSEPDMRSADQAAAYLTKIRSILRYLGTCDGNMQEGSMRADVNVSVRHPGDELGTRCEIKNINSIRFVRQAIDYEAQRQVLVIESGGAIKQETRLFDTDKGETRTMRSKEDAHDYRYFPDPDLLPVKFDEEFIERIRATLPELPDTKKARFVKDYKLPVDDAAVLVSEQELANYFEQVVDGHFPRLAANWVIHDLTGALNKAGKDIHSTPVTAIQLKGLIDLIINNTISNKIAKDVFEIMFETSQDAEDIVKEKDLIQVTDTDEIGAVIDEIIVNNPKQVEQFRGGNEKIIGWFVGQVMKQTSNKANPKAVNEILRAKLKG